MCPPDNIHFMLSVRRVDNSFFECCRNSLFSAGVKSTVCSAPFLLVRIPVTAVVGAQGGIGGKFIDESQLHAGVHGGGFLPHRFLLQLVDVFFPARAKVPEDRTFLISESPLMMNNLYFRLIISTSSTVHLIWYASELMSCNEQRYFSCVRRCPISAQWMPQPFIPFCSIIIMIFSFSLAVTSCGRY